MAMFQQPDVPVIATIGIYLWPDMTHLDILGPHQVLGLVPGLKVFTFARTRDPIVSDVGLTVLPDYGFDDLPAMDVLLVGGGANTYPETSDASVVEAIAKAGAGAQYVTSVCSGSMILAEAGLLDGYKATTHWAYLELLDAYPGVEIAHDRVVIDRNRMTGGGVTAGIDFALTLVGKLVGPEAGAFVELLMEYRPAPPYGTGHPESAPAELIAAARGACAEMAPELFPAGAPA